MHEIDTRLKDYVNTNSTIAKIDSIIIKADDKIEDVFDSLVGNEPQDTLTQDDMPYMDTQPETMEGWEKRLPYVFENARA